MRLFRFLALVLCCLMLVNCELSDPDQETLVFRGKRNGLVAQTIVMVEYDSRTGKYTRRFQDYTYSPTFDRWNPVGPQRETIDSDSETEVPNLDKYEGTPGSPPSAAAVTKPSYIYLAKNSGNNEVVVLNAKTLELVTRIPSPGYMKALTASPDGLTMAVPAANQLLFIDVLTNRVSRTLALPASSSIKSIHYSIDGSRLFLTDQAAGIRIVEAATAKLLQTIPLPTGIVQLESSALSPDGEYLFVRTAGSNSSAIFDITTLSFTSGAIAGGAILFSDIPCVFKETGKEIYCLSVEGLAIFDAATMTLSGSIALPFLGPSSESVYRLHTVDGGAYLLVTTDKAVRMLSPARRKILATLKPGPDKFFTSAFPVSRF